MKNLALSHSSSGPGPPLQKPLPSFLELKALILSGGQGLRLRPLTEDRPKSLVQVMGKAIADWQFEWLKSNVELEKVVFLCGYKWEKLREHFGDSHSGIPIEYSVEESPLGTGGAIRKALLQLGTPSENVVVMNGDIITRLSLSNMVAAHVAPPVKSTVTMLLVPFKSRFGVVHMDKLKVVRKFEEKPEFRDVWINGGIYVLNVQKIMKHLPERGDIERETFPKLVDHAEITAYPYYGFWTIIDSVKDLQEVEGELRALQEQQTAR